MQKIIESVRVLRQSLAGVALLFGSSQRLKGRNILAACRGQRCWALPSIVRVGAAVVCVVATIAASSQDAWANRPLSERLIDDTLVAQIRGYLHSPIVTAMVSGSNLTRSTLSDDDIIALDKAWRAEREADAKPLIARALSNPLSAYLTRIQANSVGLVTEIIVVGVKGLNVGQSAVTSDMWQGDEAKFQRTFLVAPDAIFIDAAEFHEGSKTWRAQVNLTIADPETGAAIGAATFEINLTELNRRRS
ncbi:MAG: hypothetical protein AAGJ94_02005 [Pseudomonadota bacterium]